MDCLVKLTSDQTRIRATYVDVSETARDISRRHLTGPSASMVLGEALTAVSLMSADMSREGECITLRLEVDGPIQGYLVESTSAGTLRGFTRNKVLNAIDERPLSGTDPVLGESGHAQIVRSLPTKALSTANLRIEAPCTRVAVARYFNHSMQTPTGVSLFTDADETAVTRARGFTIERMPDGDHDAFVRILEGLSPDDAHPLLKTEDPLGGLRDMLGLEDLEERERRPLSFACRCSREKAASALKTLSPEERAGMIESGKGTTVYCHMCGRGFALDVELIKQFDTDA